MPDSESVNLFMRILNANGPVSLGELVDSENIVGEYCVETIKDWERGGAETYFTILRVSGSGKCKDFVIKACAPFSPGIPIVSVLDKWQKRRQIVSRDGVLVARLYGVGEGSLIEEFLPYGMQDLTPEMWSPRMSEDVLRFAKCLSARRFHALAPFADLRSDGQRIFVVDFGADLGDPNAVEVPLDYLSVARAWLEGRGAAPSISFLEADQI